MSASIDVPQSPKKRKIEVDGSTKSKKRRKHTESNTEEQSIPSQPQEVKDNKSKRKSKKLAEHDSQDQDIEMVDSTLPDPQTSQRLQEDLPLSNGVPPSPDTNGDIVSDMVEEVDETMLNSLDPTCFYSKRLSLYVPIPAVSLATSTSSLLSLHLSPLLLTYFPPVKGVVLSFSDPILTARAETGVNLPLQPPTTGQIPRNPPDDTFAQCADQFGVCWVWLTATFLVFAPQPGDNFKGWANIQSESFIGLVSYNYFQTSVLKNRIPRKWTFDGPSREQKQKRKGKKGKLRGENGDVAEEVDPSQTKEVPDNNAANLFGGSFLDEDGQKVSQHQVIKVNDVDMTPGSDRNRFGLQIDGSLLSQKEEETVLAEEKRQYDARRRPKSRSQTPELDDDDGELPLMSGGLAPSRELSVV